MTSIDANDLGRRITDLVRQVRENGEIVEIVDRGEVIARIVPGNISHIGVDEGLPHSRQLAELDRLIADIRPYLPDNVDAVEAIRDIRR